MENGWFVVWYRKGCEFGGEDVEEGFGVGVEFGGEECVGLGCEGGFGDGVVGLFGVLVGLGEVGDEVGEGDLGEEVGGVCEYEGYGGWICWGLWGCVGWCGFFVLMKKYLCLNDVSSEWYFCWGILWFIRLVIIIDFFW